MRHFLKSKINNSFRLKLKVEKFFKENLWQYLTVIAILSIFAWLFNKPIETILFCISHIVIRKHFDKQYHSGFTSMCLFITISIGFLGISTCIPIEISLFSSIPIACFICWVGYLAQDRIDLIKYKNQNNDFKFDIKTCTEEDLRKQCYLKGIRKFADVEECVKHFILKTPHEEIDRIRPETSKMRRNRWRKRLTK